jgi:hypothetical protein
MPSRSEAAGVTIRPEAAWMTVQRQAQVDRDACDRLLKAIFDRGLGQRQIAHVTGIPLSTVQRALQRVIYSYRRDRRIASQDAPTRKKRRAKLESLAIDQLQPTRGPTAGTQGQAPKSRIAPRKSRVTLAQDEGDPAGEAPALQGHASERCSPVAPAGAVAKAEPTERRLKEARGTAKLAIPPSANAAMVLEEFGERFGDLDVGALAAHLKDGLNDIRKNDLGGCEAMLYCQAHALQAIFVSSAHRATLSEEWFPNYEVHMRLALKAQSQCRATLETLATIKNPQWVAFVQQANIAHGPQQVNNGMMPAGKPRAGTGKPKSCITNYWKKSHERLDTGTTGAAVGADTHLAAVGENDRTEDAAR